MSVQNGERLVTKQDLADMYQGIRPYLGGMPEVVANKFSKGDLYSTDEKMIGQWIDGKPLYQKVVKCEGLPNNTSKTYDYDISNVDKFVSIYAVGINRDNLQTIPIPYIYNNDSYTMFYWVSTSITIATGIDRSSYDGYVFLQYTKTTDTAISIGSDTDYSTTEKIVGTWVDGEPVYQKVIALDTVTLGTAYNIDVSSLNIGRLLFACGNGTLRHNDGEEGLFIFPSAGTGTYTQTVFIKGNKAGTGLVIYSNKSSQSSTQTITNGYVVIQYTKAS